VTFSNTTTLSHLVAARDGSWSTGSIAPGGSASIVVDRPGTYEYVCHDHLWSIGQLIVE
jgi:plastocyanin